VFELPDGNKLTLTEEQLCSPEMLFYPTEDTNEEVGIHDAVQDSIMKAEMDTRGTLFKNIVLSGGTTITKGFSSRLTEELTELNPKKRLQVIDGPNRQYTAWIGGATMSSTSKGGLWLSKKEYEERGADYFKGEAGHGLPGVI